MKPSSFDTLLEAIEDDLKTQFPTTAFKSSGDNISGILERAVARDQTRSDHRGTPTHHGRLVAADSLLFGLQKRYVGRSVKHKVTPKRKRERDAELIFLKSNDRCRDFNFNTRFSDLSPFTKTVLTEARSLLEGWCYKGDNCKVNLTTVAKGMYSGPGAISGLPTKYFPASMYARLGDSPMTFSSASVQRLYNACCMLTPLSLAAEKRRRSVWGDADDVSGSATFLSVLKTTDTNRGICKHLSGNQALTLGLHVEFTNILREECGIDIQDQQFKNRELARIGSMGPIANHKLYSKAHKMVLEFCTWDATEASNFPILFAEWLLPTQVFTWVCATRSPTIIVGGKKVTKHMLSTMGNGFTFSLMTLLFTAIVIALYRCADLPLSFTDKFGVTRRAYGVYGDDIIVDKSVYNALNRVMTECGILVNEKKSYSSGYFRESCGGDFYDGYSVRPVFCENLESKSEIYSLHNRLLEWSAYHSINLDRSLTFLRSLIKDAQLVPNCEDTSAGFYVSRIEAQNSLPIRACRDRKVAIKARENGWRGTWYEAWLPKARLIRLKREEVIARPYTDISTREVRHYNDVVAEFYLRDTNFYAFTLYTLSGHIRDGAFNVRQFIERRAKTTRYVPSWGDVTVDRVYPQNYGGYSLEVYRHLESFMRRAKA